MSRVLLEYKEEIRYTMVIWSSFNVTYLDDYETLILCPVLSSLLQSFFDTLPPLNTKYRMPMMLPSLL